MSVPLADLHLKFLVEHTIRTFRQDPDKYTKEVFGDAALEPHAALYGNIMFEQVKKWITETEIPVAVGFDLDSTQIPGVTIHLEASPVERQFMGDAGFVGSMPLEPQEIPVIVGKFSPAKIELSSTNDYFIITLPDSMSDDDQALIVSGLRFRDKNNRLYSIGKEKTNPTAIPIEGYSDVQGANLSELEVISPYNDQMYREGAMYYNENLLLTVHGHADRQEGLWLWAIVQWGILKFRPILTSTFGLDLAVPSASDFSKDDQFLGTNVWRRFITLQAKVVWSWQSAKQVDVLGYLLDLQGQVSNEVGSDNGTEDASNPLRLNGKHKRGKPKPTDAC